IERDRGICQWHGGIVSVDDYSLQHRRARGMGGVGKKNHVTNSPANGVLVCGSATTGCHGYIESHPEEALARGFRGPQAQDPRTVPIITWAGIRVWLTEDGQRQYEAEL